MTTQDPKSYADVTQGKIAHIDFKLSADFKARALRVAADYRLEQPVTGSLFLDTNGLEIEHIQAGDSDIEWELGESDPILGQRLHLKGLAGVDTFSVTCVAPNGAQALQWVEPVQTAGGEHPFLFSQCQALNARTIFPCQDTPSVRFTYTAAFEVPEPLVGVMAAELKGTDKGDGTRIFRYEMPQAIPSYLFALAAGNLAFREMGKRTGVYAEPETIEAAAWEFAETENSLSEAEKLFGPYLWGRYDILVMPPSFPFGGMENPRLTFATPLLILGSRATTWIITHEIAHAWTGNLVTNATWQHVWINEGWTTYAESRISEILMGEDWTRLSHAYNADELEGIFDRLGWDSHATRLREPDDVDEEVPFTRTPYFKGKFFLMQIEKAVGRERFDEFIQTYMAQYQFKSITSEAFLAFLRAELPGIDDKVEVDKWVYDTGLPDGYRVQSDLYDGIIATLADYEQNGVLPTKEQIAGWSYLEGQLFLLRLPDVLPIEHIEALDALFDFPNSTDASYLYEFYVRCIRSGYEEILPRVEAYLGRVGRNLVLAPVYLALVETEWSRPHARRIFDQVKASYHPMTVAGGERILQAAGL